MWPKFGKFNLNYSTESTKQYSTSTTMTNLLLRLRMKFPSWGADDGLEPTTTLGDCWPDGSRRSVVFLPLYEHEVYSRERWIW